MLRFMRIRDLALIRSLEIEFNEGLTVLTGETGSGKSILVDAFGLLAGSRSSPEMVRSNCDTAVIEGAFSVENKSVGELLESAGFELEDDLLLIRREITAGGRGRVFVNNSLSTLSLLKSLGSLLADIHGQQDHQALLDLATHLKWLDRFAGNTGETGELRSRYGGMRDIARRLEALAMDEQERKRLLDILRFQVEEIRRADIRAGEKEELENERSVLANREKIFALASETQRLLYEGEPSLAGLFDRIMRLVQQLAEFDATWAAHVEGLRESQYRLEDLTLVARDYPGSIDFTPERLDQIERRLADFDRLLAKYGKSMEEVLAFADRSEKRLLELETSDDWSVRLAVEFEAGLKEYLDRAEMLSSKRHKDALRLEREIRKEFQTLAMEKMELGVHFHLRDRPTVASYRQIPAFCGPDGVDQIEFLLAPNPGEDMRPLSRIASGGELSRIMLAIKTLCGGGEGGKTLVFDEIDAGIGGRVAEVVGKRLRDVSSHSQVLCVTHLPQIAAHARNHLCVRKETLAGRTETLVEPLQGSARVEELARMLGGEVLTETTRRHAREMLAHASKGGKAPG